MSVRNIDKGFVYAPTHIQIPYTGAASGTIDVYYQAIGGFVLIFIPQFTFTIANNDFIYFTLPTDVCLPSSTRVISFTHNHIINTNTMGYGTYILNISTGTIQMDSSNLTHLQFTIGINYIIPDSTLTYMLV